MKNKKIKQALIALALSSAVFNVAADWSLNNKESTLNFISIKNLTIGEVHRFKTLEGHLKDDGSVNVSIILDSVDTRIPKRDERMKKVLFSTTKFPKATIATKVDSKKISGLKAGESFLQTAELELSIAGKKQEVEGKLRITALTDKTFLASTVQPIIINLANFELIKGIGLLKGLAKLSSISTAVPVTASFIFEK
ncbi:MAG: YceI family protein [Methylococcales bacterium]|nr:YceI family protein [Methylococcales bacterium]